MACLQVRLSVYRVHAAAAAAAAEPRQQGQQQGEQQQQQQQQQYSNRVPIVYVLCCVTDIAV
jgi:hypothetical protein